MSHDSAVRAVAKRILGTVLPEGAYQRVLAASVVRDLRTGRLSEPELALIPHAAREGETVIDVGANHGLWCASLSAAVGHEGRVVAFEPVPYTAATLRRVIASLGLANIDLRQQGLAAESGSAAFAVPVQPSGVTDAALAHLADRDDEDPGGAAARIVEAPVARLDDLIGELGEVSLLKVDVEGGELGVLQGAEGLLDRDAPTIVCEVDADYLEGFGVTPADLHALLAVHGYRRYGWNPERGELEGPDLPPGPANNQVFVTDRRRERLAAVLPA